MSDTNTLYDQDFFAWTKQQAKALRAAAKASSNLRLDWEHLAEEVEDLGKSDRRELRSQIRRIIRHLVKLQWSPAVDPRRGWRESVRDARSEIQDVLADSPSLVGELDDLVNGQTVRGIGEAVDDMADQGEQGSLDLPVVRRSSYTTGQIIGDWFPPEPPRGE
ncbi:MAG TPA: DUF29 domain-containing protein [Stellaceae bacterium]|nr:DUF29 domain-containing protein [Stellaceae bacterium]